MDNETMVIPEDSEVLETEAVEEEVDTSESISSFADTEEEETPPEEPKKEPGYVQGRINQALAREKAKIMADVEAAMEKKYAPLREKLLEMDAQELVTSGAVKDIETARELVAYRQGREPKEEPKAEPRERDASGKFAPKQVDGRIEFLAKQADKVKAKTGIDVVAIMESDSEIRDKIFSGELDFYEVAEMNKGKKRPPSPTRTPNGANGYQPNAIESMSDAQFKRLEKKIKEEGVRYSLR